MRYTQPLTPPHDDHANFEQNAGPGDEMGADELMEVVLKITVLGMGTLSDLLRDLQSARVQVDAFQVKRLPDNHLNE